MRTMIIKMIRLGVLLSGALLTAAVSAEPSSEVAFDADTRALLKSGDVERGRELSDSAKCTRCHGEAGIGEEPEDVNIAGQIASYTFKQLMDYKSGHRESRDMKKAVRRLEPQEMADLAAYYASLPLPAIAGVTSGNVMQLVKKGDHTRMLKSCNSCHGQRGQGDAFETPAIVGQKPEYFIATLEAMRDDERTNDIYARMRLIAKVLTDEEIQALAAYYSDIPVEE